MWQSCKCLEATTKTEYTLSVIYFPDKKGKKHESAFAQKNYPDFDRFAWLGVVQNTKNAEYNLSKRLLIVLWLLKHQKWSHALAEELIRINDWRHYYSVCRWNEGVLSLVEIAQWQTSSSLNSLIIELINWFEGN